MPMTNSHKRNKSPPKSTTQRQHKFTQAKQTKQNRQHDANDKFTSETKSTEIDDIMPIKISSAPEMTTPKDNNSKR
ncbi:14820_t:CDS:2 [Racocetra persica]|uniref:14820_t:CDS:1 n=1 Tax=Racocetra persica TaxID=160502 RepID=A0ACA9LIE7_9GLOM|nr:14820_t:CDS:2 [Racocetra persica]